MCGLLGIASTAPLAISDRQVARLRDLMTHRGPDDAGLWRGGPMGNVILAHRRLAVLDPSPAGRQPMATPDGRFVLVYNGELYNEPDLRRQLLAEGRRLETGCDTEVVLHWLATRGGEGLRDLRGMYALALFDATERRLLLARDPLGIKPLYWWQGRDPQTGQPLLVFASEVRPILEHPAVTPAPDMVGVSAYLTTIRPVLGDRTLFEGVRAMPPGRVIAFDLSGSAIGAETRDLGIPSHGVPDARAERFAEVRRVVCESVELHLRADVPTCSLLSGGLDSAIVTAIAAERHPSLRTYCAGAAEAAGGQSPPSDFYFARMMAGRLGTNHAEAPIDESLFLARWREMVARQGVPLSTPNEVAINEVARRLRADGHPVTLSGEGADELFGGYDHSMRPAAAHVAAGNTDPGLFHLGVAAWCPLEFKPTLFTEAAWANAGEDEWVRSHFRSEFASIARGDDPPTMLADHLRFQRRLNLAGLLLRLDSATMLESVEGRTPFADGVVATLAESLPIDDRFVAPDRTKIALREAFGAILPPEIVTRPKASFPLPFEQWVRGAGAWIRESAWLRSLLRPEAVELLAANPQGCWRMAWPVANLALWAEHWWPQHAPDAAHSRHGVTAS